MSPSSLPPTRATPRPVDRHLAIALCVIRGNWQALGDLNLLAFAADDSFGRYATRQNICQYTLQRLQAAGTESLFPQTWLENLRGTVSQGAGHHLKLIAALQQILHAFKEAGIPFLLLKGITFAQKYYGSEELRRMADIDLMVHPADINRSLLVLFDLGFTCKPRRVKRFPDGPRINPRLLRTYHALSLKRDGVPLDLHWQFRAAPAYRLDSAALWDNAQHMTWRDCDCSMPSDEDALILLLLSISHDIARGACKLKHLLDVDQLLARSNFDWPSFLSRCASENTLSVCVNVLSVVLDVMDGRNLFPHLNAALAAHDALVVARGREASIRLMHPSSPDGVEGALWFIRIYPVAPMRDGIWLFSRTCWHPGRYFTSPFRAARLAWRMVKHRSQTT